MLYSLSAPAQKMIFTNYSLNVIYAWRIQRGHPTRQQLCRISIPFGKVHGPNLAPRTIVSPVYFLPYTRRRNERDHYPLHTKSHYQVALAPGVSTPCP